MPPDARSARGWRMSRRLQLILLICGGVVLAALLALVVVVYLLLQPERFTTMLQAQAQHRPGVAPGRTRQSVAVSQPGAGAARHHLERPARNHANPARRARPPSLAVAHL